MSCKVEINHIVANSPQNGYPEGITFESESPARHNLQRLAQYTKRARAADQDKLPKLPIPPLKESVDRFLKSTQALQVSLVVP